MKGAIIIAVIAAFVAATYGAPVTSAPGIDWIAVGDKTEEIRTFMKDAISHIGNVSATDNPTVGAAMEKKAHSIFGKIKSSITAETLTHGQAQSFLDDLKDIMETLQADITNDVSQLSPEAQAEISQTLNNSMAEGEMRAAELLDMLAAPVASIFVVDWTAVGAKVEEVRNMVTVGVNTVRTTALADNPIVGGQIAANRCGRAAGLANGVLGRAKQAVSDQTLTADGARAMFAELRTILDGAQTDMGGLVAQLSPAAQTPIRDTLASAMTQVEAKAQEIYDSLAAVVSTFVVDWTAVEAHVEEVRAMVTAGVNTVRTTALADNPMVGGRMAGQLGMATGMINAVLGHAKQAVTDQTMTADQARAIFDTLWAVLEGVQTSMSGIVAQLSPAAQTTISNTIDTAVSEVDAKANEIFASLDVEEVRAMVTAGVNTVRTTALADNPIVGGQIAAQLGVAAGMANAVVGRAKQAISDQTLTSDQARAMFSELRTILGGVQNDMSGLVAQLSPAAQTTIRDTLASAMNQVEAKAQEIYDSLDAARLH